MKEDKLSTKSETKIALLEQQATILMEQFKQYSEDNKVQHNELKDLIAEIRVDVKEAMAKKSDIWVEKAFTWLLYTVAGIIVGALMYLIIRYKI